MTKDRLILALLEEVVTLWRDKNTDVQIGSDVRKIELLEEVRKSLAGTSCEVPTEVLDLYSKVYLRDVWSSRDIRREGETSPSGT